MRSGHKGTWDPRACDTLDPFGVCGTSEDGGDKAHKHKPSSEASAHAFRKAGRPHLELLAMRMDDAPGRSADKRRKQTSAPEKVVLTASPRQPCDWQHATLVWRSRDGKTTCVENHYAEVTNASSAEVHSLTYLWPGHGSVSDLVGRPRAAQDGAGWVIRRGTSAS
jgi:hypothetical protein